MKRILIFTVFICVIFRYRYHLISMKCFPNSNSKRLLLQKLYLNLCKPMILEILWYQCKDRDIYTMKPNRAFIDLHIHSPLIFSSEVKVTEWLEQLNIHTGKKNLDLYLKPYIKNNTKWILGLNIEVKSKVQVEIFVTLKWLKISWIKYIKT